MCETPVWTGCMKVYASVPYKYVPTSAFPNSVWTPYLTASPWTRRLWRASDCCPPELPRPRTANNHLNLALRRSSNLSLGTSSQSSWQTLSQSSAIPKTGFFLMRQTLTRYFQEKRFVQITENTHGEITNNLCQI